MLTMMTNYTNHNYNSNNDDDNISITIILWINFNPFRCTGSFRRPWYWRTCIGTLVADSPAGPETSHNDQLGGGILELGGVILEMGGGLYWSLRGRGVGGSVERDRQNRDLYSNWTKRCEDEEEQRITRLHILYDWTTDHNTVGLLQYTTWYISILGLLVLFNVIELFRGAEQRDGTLFICWTTLHHFIIIIGDAEFSSLRSGWDSHRTRN